MYKLITIKLSCKKDKKLDAIFIKTKTGKIKRVSFGAKGYPDFTTYSKSLSPEKAKRKKRQYIKRHQKRENWNNPNKPGTLSRYMLWNKSSKQASIHDFKNRFNL